MKKRANNLHRVFEIKEILSYGRFEVLSNFLFKIEKNEGWTLIYVESGKAELITEKLKKQGIALEAGDLYLQIPNEEYSLCGVGDSRPKIFEVEFNCQGQLIFIKKRKIHLQEIETSLVAMIAEECDRTFVPALGGNTEGEIEPRAYQSYGGEQMAEMYMEQLMILLARRAPADRKAAGKLENMDLVRHICDFFAEHISEKMSLDRISEEFDVGKSTFESAFSERYKTGAIDYFYRMRAEAAREALREAAMNEQLQLSEIVKQFGYSSATTFGRQFRRYIGMSPLEYLDYCRDELDNPVYKRL